MSETKGRHWGEVLGTVDLVTHYSALNDRVSWDEGEGGGDGYAADGTEIGGERLETLETESVTATQGLGLSGGQVVGLCTDTALQLDHLFSTYSD